MSKTKKSVIDISKIGRNDPCPCGSGRKAKKCCWEDINRLVQIDPSTIKRKWKEGDLEQLIEDLDRDTYNTEFVKNNTSIISS